MSEPKDPNTYVDENAPVVDRGIKFVAGKEIYNLAFHCTIKDLWPREHQKAEPQWVESINNYLVDFCRPIRTIADELRCVACNQQVTGHHILLMNQATKHALSWDPSTNEGRCEGCGYPVRVRHTIRTLDGQQVLVDLQDFPLFYHPSAIKKRGR